MKITFGLITIAAILAVTASQGWLHVPKPSTDVLQPISDVLQPISNTLQPITNTLHKVTEKTKENFGQFKKTFKKSYKDPEEEKKRVLIFSINQEKIKKFAKDTAKPFKLAVNEFSDLLSTEFNKLLNGLKINRGKCKGRKHVHEKNVTIPIKVDWRDKGAVTPIKSQGQCGSCYAFTTAAMLESYFFTKTGKLEDLSPQNIVDCTMDQPYENYGCISGAVDPALDFVKDHGINSESIYPYKEEVGEKCQFKNESSIGTIKGYVLLDEGDEKSLEEVVATKGPVAVGIDAHLDSFHNYAGGIYYDPKCNSTVESINHAVLVIGFGTEEDGQKYWLIKNSYGTTWGENGYAKMGRNVTNPCGIATYALYPIV